MKTDSVWLDQVREEALEPARAIIDPHHHLWDYPGSRYLLDELLADLGSGHNIVATVFVECSAMYRAGGAPTMRPVGETEFVNGIGAMSASGGYGDTRIAAGIISHADLLLGADVGPVLDAHIAAAPARFRGIRHAAGWDASDKVRNSHSNPPRGILLDPAFQDGVRQLAQRDLVFEAWLYHPQVTELTALARAVPDVTIVLDHFGGPLGIGPYAGQRDEIFGQWKLDVADLAACPNVVAKLGGLVMKLNGYGWHRGEEPPSSQELAAANRDWYRHLIDCFGPHRCMYESNFPVDKVSVGYGVLWNAFKRISDEDSEADKSALFHDTAERIYRLG
ncbi:MAG: amidohydrolase family protein [Alphaproteobacteria bacterium]|jgi:L-fuconolactonase|nr:amidohydrolase family protein [Rhodospirillaceae bacterium]MBT7614188.1 amidohydrolase family protein [Rhodospirillaceae bacterium]MDG2481405.1 amidohydrolase family protein [Alphaproteobacteria bacterium]